MSAESAAAPAVPAAAIGFAAPDVLLVAAGCGTSEEDTLAAAGDPTPVIELVCATSITLSLCHPLLNFVNTHLVQALTFNQLPPPAYIPADNNASSPTLFKAIYVGISSARSAVP